MGRIPSWAKVVLFLSSYSPLYVIVALRAHNAEHSILGYQLEPVSLGLVELSYLSIGSLILTIASVAFLAVMIRMNRTRQGQLSEIEHYRNRSDMFTEYLLVYIFPFIVFEFSDMFDVAAFLVLFVTVAAIVIRSNRLFVNPVLIAFRYRVYEVETEHDRRILLTKEPLDGNNITVNTARISNDVYITTR
ncbi:hypothetical protein OB919_02975 [Halobacteria archaeon AArc-curdl1]|uniref:Uncharacterized protein n=1 Tax=Natronosalvus hydrolyticus TaxID=2979988 RepID=A0AAP3E621_9EURY|nr:hypothetical protein [Halobacteria archaeon AArc-curdl1]